MPSRMRHLKYLARWLLVLVAVGLLLVACGAGQETSDEEDVPEAALAAREALASELDVELESATIQSYEQVEWSDSCLGLGGPAEICLAGPHPGWQVMLVVDGQTYEVRLDESAKTIRIKE